jgi:hypothetical protein
MDKSILNKATSSSPDQPDVPGWMYSTIASFILFFLNLFLNLNLLLINKKRNDLFKL